MYPSVTQFLRVVRIFLLRYAFKIFPTSNCWSLKSHTTNSLLLAQNYNLPRRTQTINKDFSKLLAIAKENECGGTQNVNIIFPGGWIYFYWQIGAASYIRDIKNYDLNADNVQFAGASAGALAATLTTTGVDFDFATESALRLAEEYKIWDRPLGLQG